MLCPKCHTNNPDGEKYCRNCGFQLNASRICPECGAHNKHDTKFCRECGASLSPVSSFRRDIIDNQNAPFFDKYKSLIIAAIILVLAVGAVTGIALYNNASSNTGRSDDGFSFFPLANDTNQDNIQVDDVNDTNESVNGTNKTLNDTDKNKTSDKNNSTDKSKKSTKNKTSDSNNNVANNKTNKSVENHSKEINSDDHKDSKNAPSDSNSDKSSKVASSDSKSDKSSKAVLSDTKSDESSKNTSSDDDSETSLDNQTPLNASTDNKAVDEGDDDYGNISDENNQSEEKSNEIDMSDVPKLAREVKSSGYGFSSIEFDGNDFSQSQCIAIFAEYISGSTSGSMEIPQVASASSPSGDDSSQSVSKQDYMGVANDVNAYVSSNGRIPDNAVISGDEISEISPSKILELFTEVITENFPESVDI